MSMYDSQLNVQIIHSLNIKFTFYDFNKFLSLIFILDGKPLDVGCYGAIKLNDIAHGFLRKNVFSPMLNVN
jgi:hypothetical protein